MRVIIIKLLFRKKTSSFQYMYATVWRTFKIRAVFILLYGSESWMSTKIIINTFKVAEIQFFYSETEYTLWDCKRNADIRKELNEFSKIVEYYWDFKWKDSRYIMPYIGSQMRPLQKNFIQATQKHDGHNKPMRLELI